MIKSFLIRLIPRSLAGQLVAVTLLGLVITQAVMLAMFAYTAESNFKGRFHRFSVQRMADVAQLISAVEPGLHDSIIRAARNRYQRFYIDKAPTLPKGAAQLRIVERALLVLLRERNIRPQSISVMSAVQPRRVREASRMVWRERRFEGPPPDAPRRWRPPPPREQERQLVFSKSKRRSPPRTALFMSVTLENGHTLHSRIMSGPKPRIWASPIVWTTLATALVLGLLLILAARRISRPLRDLSRAAARLGTRESLGSLTERGPDDVRSAIRAFNAMDQRLTRMLEHQRRMLAAVGHDLRTPITALRLRTEFVEDEENRERMGRILDELETLTEGILSLVREETREEPLRRTDLTALAASICADFEDMGADVVMTTEERVVAKIRGGTITRILRNLVENAIRYGGNAQVSVTTRADGAPSVIIEDNGPGIEAEALDRVFEPFVRLEESRNAETGGLGLGLTIARSLIEAEGGRLILSNRPEGGLRAEIQLPVHAARHREASSKL